MTNSRLQQRKILITGGAGFLGVHVAQVLAAHGARLLLQDTAHKRPDLLGPVLRSGQADFVICDLEALDQSPALTSQLPDVDYVVHLGWRVPASDEPAEQLARSLAGNLAPFEQLLARLPRSLKGICLASTLAVYGGPSAEPVAENTPAQPLTAGAQTKLAMERALLEHGRQTRVPVTVLRFSSLFGPGEAHSPRAVPSFIRNLLAGEPPVIYGDGGDVYDYLYVTDAARAVLLALEHMEDAPGIYNIGSGYGWTTRAVAETIQRLAQMAVPPKHMPARGPRQSLIADIGRAAARLQFCPETPLEAGLAAEIAYCRSQALAGSELTAPDGAHGLLMRPAVPTAVR